jgi:hypothetical protein
MASAAANDPQLIELGVLLPGATLLPGGEKGVSETYRGIVEAGGQPISCYVKFLELREVFNEALGSVLCNLVGLRTPTAFVVEVRRADYPGSPALASAGVSPTAIAFATAALPIRAFMRRADLVAPDAKKAAVERWKEWPQVLTFDQWIRNFDRHTANFLIGAPGEVYLIDHGLAFGGKGWNAASLATLPPNDAMTRLWTDLLVHTTDLPARVGAVTTIQTFAAELQSIDATAACVLTQLAAEVPDADRSALATFLASRASAAPVQVCNTIGVPILPLAANP